MMQRFERFRSARCARTALLAACASAACFACSSEHRLGDLTPVDLGEGEGSTAGTTDFGSAQLGAPAVTMAESSFVEGSYVTSIGDFDGDGFGDFVTRNWDYGSGIRYVHLRYGGPRPSEPTEAFAFAEGGARLMQENLDELNIESISAVGDVDGDGYADFLVGLLGCREVSAKAYLFYGGPERLEGVAPMADAGVLLAGPPPTSPSWRYCAGAGDSKTYTAGLGDFDGDGFDDFVLTVPQPEYYDSPEAMALDRQFAEFEGELVFLDNVAYVFYGAAERIPSGTSWQSADARLSAPQQLSLVPAGDVNADGLSDLILGDEGYSERVAPPQPYHALSAGYFWLPGQTQRLSGDLALAQVATSMLPRAESAGDLDGDGVRDVLVYDDAQATHLFYGSSGLFDAGVDFAASAATFQPYTGEPHVNMIAVPDRDGDGDDELVSSFALSEEVAGWGPRNVAVLSGTSSRVSGAVQLPEPTNPFLTWPGEYVEEVFSAGDLDGDGIGDIITRAGSYSDVVDPQQSGARPSVTIDGVTYGRYDSITEAQLNVHYGTRGEALAAPPR